MGRRETDDEAEDRDAAQRRARMRGEPVPEEPTPVAPEQRVAVSISQQQRVGSTIEARFARFHAAHPEVYVKLVELARALTERGYTHLGIGMLWETLRYHTMLGARPDEDAFRLNDHYRSRYVRLIMAQEHDLDGMFELRELRAE